jgi:glycerol-3-phosphate dehydrogenase
VVGAGVVGAATALGLSRRGAGVVLLEAEAAPGLAASGTNSGILHTGFDSVAGELETDLILRAAQVRDPVLAALGVPVLRCGAVMRDAPDSIVANAQRNGVAVARRANGTLEIPGESVTDPVAYTRALALAAQAQGADVRFSFEVADVRRANGNLELGSAGGERIGARVVVNCAGLHADDVARLAGDDSFEIYPRKGEFLVFEPPDGETLEQILLPVPTKRTKGVLVFPTIDGKVIAGPTAVDQEDKDDWSVRPGARDEVLPKAVAMWPPLERARQIAEYAGLRPAGRGTNYLIGPSRACAGFVNVAAIRSTGLTASAGIADHVCSIVSDMGIELGPPRPLAPVDVPPESLPWWQRTALHRSR